MAYPQGSGRRFGPRRADALGVAGAFGLAGFLAAWLVQAGLGAGGATLSGLAA